MSLNSDKWPFFINGYNQGVNVDITHKNDIVILFIVQFKDFDILSK